VPTTLDRRRFLQGLLAAGGATAIGVPSWLADLAGGATPAGPTDGVLVVVTLLGGNDPLNTLTPISGPDRDRYAALRPSLALPTGSLLPVGDGTQGLHPSLTGLAARFAQGTVAIVRGVGTNGDGSHFVTQDRLMAGTATSSVATGWLGRYADGLSDWDGGFGEIAVGAAVPLHLVGQRVEVTSVPTGGVLWGADPAERSSYDVVRRLAATPSGLGAMADAAAAATRDAVDRAGVVSGMFGGSFPATPLGRDLTMAARAINADLGTRCVSVGRHGWDTHAVQANAHASLLAELDGAIAAFFTALSPAFQNRVTVLVVSEFGRRAAENSGRGTDHGAAGMAMVIGDNVRGGLYGASPSLTTFDSSGSLVPTVDVRSVYASLVGPWLAGDSTATLGGTYEDLQLFRAGPGSTPVP
jgi:uncharacterized protein (DUF1501 family)